MSNLCPYCGECWCCPSCHGKIHRMLSRAEMRLKAKEMLGKEEKMNICKAKDCKGSCECHEDGGYCEYCNPQTLSEL